MEEQIKFYSKILLFGEYALIFGSEALSMPYRKRFGYFDFPLNPTSIDSGSNRNLRLYLSYLRRLLKEDTLNIPVDVDRMENDINRGLVFKSNIPSGYGQGSSGALVAAIVHSYGQGKKDNQRNQDEDLQNLKQDFARLESYFHGTSSGLDPLVSYLRKAVLVEESQQLKMVDLPTFSDSGNAGMFLIDSGRAGKTQPLVDYFMEQCGKTDYMERIRTELIPLNQQCIKAFLTSDWDGLFPPLKQLSAFTLKQMSPMVPNQLAAEWERGLKNDDYYLKLCGSGGGGMLLGFTLNLLKVTELLRNYSPGIIYRFY